jgi:hypothetical protein
VEGGDDKIAFAAQPPRKLALVMGIGLIWSWRDRPCQGLAGRDVDASHSAAASGLEQTVSPYFGN